jgi:hypothetical protein
MDTNSTMSTNSYYQSNYSIDTSMSTDSSSIYSTYSQKNYANMYYPKINVNQTATKSKWFSTKIRSTTNKPLKRKEYKIKPKSINSKQNFCIRLTSANSTTAVTDHTYGLDTLFNMDKHLTNKYRSTILKIMDKPLEWFRIKSKKSNLRRKSTTNFKSLVVNKNAMISSHTNNKSQIVNLNFLMSAPSMSSSLNYEIPNSDISNNYLNYNSYLTEQKLHSTPQSQYCNQFSPIAQLTSTALKNSYLSSSNSSTNSSLFVSTPKNVTSKLSKINKSIYSETPSLSRRLSFGITSSPKPLSFFFNEDDIIEENSFLCESMYDQSQNFHCSDPDCSNLYDYNEKELRLIEHINCVKHNVQLGVLMRNESQSKKETKRNLFKCTKLQKIFQKKLRKQIKQTRNW